MQQHDESQQMVTTTYFHRARRASVLGAKRLGEGVRSSDDRNLLGRKSTFELALPPKERQATRAIPAKSLRLHRVNKSLIGRAPCTERLGERTI